MLCREQQHYTCAFYYVTVSVFDGAGASDARPVTDRSPRQVGGPGRAGPSHRPGDGKVEQEPRRELE